MKAVSQQSGDLHSWDEISDQGWTGILVGNGASIAVWDRFRYASLYQAALSTEMSGPLTDQDQALFDAMGTQNFEAVLSALLTSKIVSGALHLDTRLIGERYESIRQALIEAVISVHIPWTSIQTRVLEQIRTALRAYDSVYSTNYDLLVYWAIMSGTPKEFPDYFWGANNSFDSGKTEIWVKHPTRVLYLHGAVHLYRDTFSITFKAKAEESWNLLEQFAGRQQRDVVPLFISEGTSENKLEAIRRSDYLSFAYEQFSRHEGPLVVFGHSLGESDQHLVAVMNARR